MARHIKNHSLFQQFKLFLAGFNSRGVHDKPNSCDTGSHKLIHPDPGCPLHPVPTKKSHQQACPLKPPFRIRQWMRRPWSINC